MSDVNAYEVYASLAAVAQLVGVSERRVQKWVNHGRLTAASALTGGPRPRHKVLYSLGEVMDLAQEEGRVYKHERGEAHGNPSSTC